MLIWSSLTNNIANTCQKAISNQYHKYLDELLHEKERYKAISEELDSTFQELSGY